MLQLIEKYVKGDRAIWLIALFLSIASLLLVYSSISTLAFSGSRISPTASIAADSTVTPLPPRFVMRVVAHMAPLALVTSSRRGIVPDGPCPVSLRVRVSFLY